MAYTTKEIVKKHILEHHLGSKKVENERLCLSGSDWSPFRKRMILDGSEKIKGKEQIEPTRESVKFTAADTMQLSHSELICDTVVAASDSSLGTLYIENVDFNLNYDSGEFTRILSGSIPQGAEVAVWYLYYRVYEKGVDYSIDYQKGQLKRLTSGAIESGQWVDVDYTAEYDSLDDSSIENAISEANNQVIAFIDEAHYDSADNSLVGAETYLAVSIICRIRAMESISPSRGETKSADAMSWTALSEMYKKEAYNLLSRFSGPLSRFNSPSRA